MKLRAGRQGSCVIELILGLCVLVPIILYGVDVAAILLASGMLNGACCEAARMASNGPPASLIGPHENQEVLPASPPYQRAIASLATGGHPAFLQIDPNLHVIETVVAPIPVSPSGNPVNGEVTVQMQATVAVPCVLPCLPSFMTVSAQKTFPYTWTVPATTSTT